MKFRPDGPDIPEALMAAQERGDVLFICGAGVSMATGLPSFRDLVQGVYAELGEDWALHEAEREGMLRDGRMAGQYDRVLRALERRLAASNLGRTQGMRERVRTAVRASLAPPPDPNLSNHAALLTLSRGTEGETRLATTNFDTLFEQAWPGGAAPSHAGPAMPQARTAGFTGIMHLHGRLRDEAIDLDETEIVLTSAEFGDAYLREGWASRYVYDLVRAYTVVLVGYQADDPPMRYLLEVLEADRERFRDLQKVYAFAHADAGQEALEAALWRAKGVEPILHGSVEGDYAPLYDSLREWATFAEDPTAWRRAALERLIRTAPDDLAAPDLVRALEILGHNDAGGLLAALNPDAAWLDTLRERGRLGLGTDRVPVGPPPIRLGAWIAQRTDDPAMIASCAGLAAFDGDTVWFLERALDRPDGEPLSAVRRSAWDLLLRTRAKGPDPSDSLGMDWYRMERRVREGYAAFPARRLIADMLAPRLTITRPIRFRELEGDEAGEETLAQLVWTDFKAALEYPVDEILAVWPDTVEAGTDLISILNRTLDGALEEAADVGFLTGWDGADRDVPSVARHRQNEYHEGFYPIIRMMTDLWDRLAAGSPETALPLARSWATSRFTLVRRLALFAGAEALVPADEAAGWVEELDDDAFWVGGARVELTRLLIARWDTIDGAIRDRLEARIVGGVPRSLFRDDIGWEEDEWNAIRDNSIYRLLTRLQGAGCALKPETEARLAGIAAANPLWRPGRGDRDDFGSWSESRVGAEGHPEQLETVEDERLVDEALRIQQENAWEEGDLWRVFVGSDPVRALRGLNARAAEGRWDAEAWRPLLWEASEREEPELQAGLAASLLDMPFESLEVIVGSTASWIRRQRAALIEHGLWTLWDRLADIAYADVDRDDEGDIDLETRSLNDAGGVLVWALIEAISATGPAAASELNALPHRLGERLDRAVDAPGYGGRLARVRMVRSLAYLNWLAPVWTVRRLAPLLSWDHPEAAALWKVQASDRIPSAALYNALRPALLEALSSEAIPDRSAEALITRLLQIVVSHQGGLNPEYDGTAAELRGMLARGRGVLRRTVSVQLWRLMGSRDEEGHGAAGAERWRTTVGPVFNSIWPLDAALRGRDTASNLVNMALGAGEAFPEAVDAVLDVITPYPLYRIRHSLLLNGRHAGLVREHPLSFVRLLSALIDPGLAAIPDDLGEVLNEAETADAAIVTDPAFRRLRALQRLGGA